MCLWKPFHGCFVRLRRGWNTKSDLIDVFASFFLLSYSKILYQIILIVDGARIVNYSLVDGHESREHVLSINPSINIGAKTAAYLSIISFNILLCLAFVIIPACLLLLYPVGVFQRLLSKCTSNRFRIILHIFVEKFQSCYRDGLNGAIKDTRSFSGFYFLLLITICLAQLINQSTFHFDVWLVRGFVFTVAPAALLSALCRPYRETSMNVIDSIFLTHLATLCYILSSNYKFRVYMQFIQTVIVFPFVVFCLTIAYRIVRGICKMHFLKRWLSWRPCNARDHDDLTTADEHQQQDVNIQPKATYGTMILDVP